MPYMTDLIKEKAMVNRTSRGDFLKAYITEGSDYIATMSQYDKSDGADSSLRMLVGGGLPIFMLSYERLLERRG